MPAPIPPIRSAPAWKPAQIGSILPGPLRAAALRCHTISACTNKPPILPYRGVARTGVCYAMETTLDALARQLGISRPSIRLANLVPPEAMPYRNLVGKVFDSGDYPEVAAPRGGGVRSRRHPRAPGARARRSGFGLATFCEQGAHGTSVYHAWGIPFVPGFEQAHARLSARRRAGSARRRAQPRPGHGDDAGAGRARDPRRPSRQGARGARRHRAHALFDRHLGQPRHGDGGRRRGRSLPASSASASPRSARRCCRSRQATSRSPTARCAARILTARSPSPTSPAPGTARRRTCRPASNKGGLEVTAGYRPDPDTGTHSYACHAVRGAGRHRDRRRRARGLSGRRGWRQAGEPHDRRRPGAGRPGARHRHRAVRGDAVRRAGPAAGRDARRLSAARHDRRARRPARPYGNAEPLDDLRPEGHRRERRDRPAGARSSTRSTTRWRRSAPR